MVVGGGNGCWGKKMKTEGVGEKNEKEGKRGKGKRRKRALKRLKNASLRVKNSKNFAGGQLPLLATPRRRQGLRPSGRVNGRRGKNYVLKVGGGKKLSKCIIYTPEWTALIF